MWEILKRSFYFFLNINNKLIVYLPPTGCWKGKEIKIRINNQETDMFSHCDLSVIHKSNIMVNIYKHLLLSYFRTDPIMRQLLFTLFSTRYF